MVGPSLMVVLAVKFNVALPVAIALNVTRKIIWSLTATPQKLNTLKFTVPFEMVGLLPPSTPPLLLALVAWSRFVGYVTPIVAPPDQNGRGTLPRTSTVKLLPLITVPPLGVK